MIPIDLLIVPRWLIPVNNTPLKMAAKESPQPVLIGQGVAVHEGKIVAVGSLGELHSQFAPKETIDLPTHILSPGLVNTHTHAAMTLLRGYADDLPLMQWLSEYIWPAESKWVNKEFISVGSRLAVAEMLMSGTTCFNDMYFFADVTAAVAEDAGMRACVGMIVLDFPTVWAKDAAEYIARGLELRDGLRHSELVSTVFAPHAPYTVSNGPLEQIATLAEELDAQIHMHVHETAHEIEESTARYGMRPLERLDQIGLVSPRLAAVHLTQLLPAEIETLADRGAHGIHCPQSNLKLASGMTPVQAMLQAGLNIAIGTDGASSNNDLDMLAETQSAAMLAKGVSGDPSAMDAYQALYAATMGGAIALDMEANIGSIEVGKAADLMAVNLNDPSTLPVFHPLSQLVYSASRGQVSDVWVNGQRLLNQRRLTTIDIDKTTADAMAWGEKISS